jgi:hypothetical protein
MMFMKKGASDMADCLWRQFLYLAAVKRRAMQSDVWQRLSRDEQLRLAPGIQRQIDEIAVIL